MGGAMKEKPILFSALMVRALLAGTKTQTRRIVKPPPKWASASCAGVDFGCPYGVPSDRLWVREAWAVPHPLDHLKPSEVPQGAALVYYAATENLGGLLKRQSLFMPRWASRITLELTAVRVERLQEISEADARAEGSPCVDEFSGREVLFPDHSKAGSFRLGYSVLWESINGAGSWAVNPWVWVLSFKRISP